MCSLQKYENFPLASITFEQPFNPKRVDELLKSKVITVEDRFILKKLSKLKQPVNSCILEPPSNGWGRYQSKKPTVSLFNLSRKTRHYLCREHYIDFDIVKSQPNVIYSYYKTNGFDTYCLEKYITNPDKWIEYVMKEFSYEAGVYDKVHCDRKEIAKKLFTSICNLGSFKSWVKKYKVSYNDDDNNDDTDISFFIQLSEEMKYNIKRAKKIEPQLWSDVTQILLAKKDKTYPESSFSAYLYHELERRILESLFSDGEEYTTGVYSLDGLMIPVSAMNGLSIEEHCETFNKRVIEVFGDGYKNVRMISKAMDEAHIIEPSQNDTSELEDDETKLNEDSQYLAIKTTFEDNNSHFYLVEQKRYFIKVIKDSDALYIPHTAQEFSNALAHLRYTVPLPNGKGTKEVSFVAEWFKDGNKLKFNNFTYDLKNHINPLYLNLWTGFDILKVQPLEEKKHQRLFGHWNKYMDIISNNDKDVRNYVEHWIAQIVQRPYKPNQVALLLQANGEGGGKTSLGRTISSILGNSKYYKTDAGFAGLFPENGFNEHLKDCFIYLADELEGEDSRKNNSRFKQFITAEKFTINGKGDKTYEIPNKINLICTSNNTNPMPVGEKARRLLIIQISDEWLGDTEVWKYHYEKIVERPSACRTIFDYYLDTERFNLDDWNPKDIPKTKLFEILRDASKDPIEEVLLELLGTNTTFASKMEEEGVVSTELLSKINDGFTKRGLKPINSVSMGLKLTKNTFCTKYILVKHTKIGRNYKLLPSALTDLFDCQIEDTKDI